MSSQLKLFTFLLTILVGLNFVGCFVNASAKSRTYSLKINKQLDGFSSRNGSLSLEQEIFRENNKANSVRVDILPENTYASLMILNKNSSDAHPDWLTDWTPYDRISTWIYFDELDTVPANKGVTVRLGGNKSLQIIVPKSELRIGWNHIEVELSQLVAGQTEILQNMEDIVLEFIVDKQETFIVNEIQLVLGDPSIEDHFKVAELITIMSSTNYGEAMQAENDLVKLGDVAVPALKFILNRDPNSWNRFKASNLLMRIGTENAISALVIGIEDSDETVQENVKKHLNNLDNNGKEIIKPILLEYAINPDFNIRQFALRLLQSIGMPNSEIALELASCIDNSTSAENEIILTQLSKLGSEASNVVPKLIDLYHQAPPEKELRLLEVVTTIGGEAGYQVMPELTEMLLSPDWDVRQEAIWGMRRLGLSGAEMIEPVQNVFSDQPLLAVDILTQLGITQPEAISALTEILADESLSHDVRQAAYSGLSNNVSQMEWHINRGLVAVKTEEGVYLGWRLLGTDLANTKFNIYRDGIKINESPISTSTNYLDLDGTLAATYYVRPIIDGVELDASETVKVLAQNYLRIPLDRPSVGETSRGELYSYSASEASVGDLTGNGQYDIILKWDPSNQKDNAHDGYTGNVYIDAYTLDGEKLWRIDLGRNIRAGAHYTQMMVYDLDGDGKAEIVMKTADGTIDGVGNVIGDPNADYRNSVGRILTGPEYLTVFDGETGAAIDTIDYKPGRGNISSWGDNYGNRVDRFLAAIAYLDGKNPSVVMARGYYTRTVLVAYDLKDGQLVERWTFDSAEPGLSDWGGQGNHQLSVADVDGDGKDEIIYGAITIDDDGTGLYNTRLGHGDALHVANHDPTRPGLEVFSVQEEIPNYAGINLRDARTGEVLWGIATDYDVGRGVAANIDPNYRGSETWVSGSSLMDIDGNVISSTLPNMCFVIWWDADLQREILETTTIYKWDWENQKLVTILSPQGLGSTTNKPPLQADLLGDWREEIMFRTQDSSELRIYTTTDLTEHRLFTLMHDRMYRTGVAWQNVAYNQPPHPSFYVGEDMDPQTFNPGQIIVWLDKYATEFGE